MWILSHWLLITNWTIEQNGKLCFWNKHKIGGKNNILINQSYQIDIYIGTQLIEGEILIDHEEMISSNKK